MSLPLPFDGAISRYFETEAPEQVREAIASARERDVLDDAFPYARWLDKAVYDADYAALQIELVKLQAHVVETGARVAVIFEGRDAAGKGGAISRIAQNLNPRVTRIAALPKPTERERGEWYFQRYVRHLPSTGEIVLFDRSWYNRAVIEHVFGFCTPAQRAHFFAQVNGFEAMLVEEGIALRKIWLNIGRAEQLRRFLARESDPLKQWKLSRIDVEGLGKWDAYTDAIAETFRRTNSAVAPWTVIRAEDKRRARLAAMQIVLGMLDYAHRDPQAPLDIDPQITGGPELWNA